MELKHDPPAICPPPPTFIREGPCALWPRFSRALPVILDVVVAISLRSVSFSAGSSSPTAPSERECRGGGSSCNRSSAGTFSHRSCGRFPDKRFTTTLRSKYMYILIRGHPVFYTIPIIYPQSHDSDTKMSLRSTKNVITLNP